MLYTQNMIAITYLQAKLACHDPYQAISEYKL